VASARICPLSSIYCWAYRRMTLHFHCRLLLRTAAVTFNVRN
jgi:hypothetical protein